MSAICKAAAASWNKRINGKISHPQGMHVDFLTPYYFCNPTRDAENQVWNRTFYYVEEFQVDGMMIKVSHTYNKVVIRSLFMPILLNFEEVIQMTW